MAETKIYECPTCGGEIGVEESHLLDKRTTHQCDDCEAIMIHVRTEDRTQ